MSPFFHFLNQQKDIANVLKVFHNGALRMISAILDDAALVKRLQEAKFDLLLTDPAFPAGVLLAKFLHLPMVYNVRWLNAGDAHMQIAPSPPSYVPMYNSLLHDQMNFYSGLKISYGICLAFSRSDTSSCPFTVNCLNAISRPALIFCQCSNLLTFG